MIEFLLFTLVGIFALRIFFKTWLIKSKMGSRRETKEAKFTMVFDFYVFIVCFSAFISMVTK